MLIYLHRLFLFNNERISPLLFYSCLFIQSCEKEEKEKMKKRRKQNLMFACKHNNFNIFFCWFGFSFWLLLLPLRKYNAI